MHHCQVYILLKKNYINQFDRSLEHKLKKTACVVYVIIFHIIDSSFHLFIDSTYNYFSHVIGQPFSTIQ